MSGATYVCQIGCMSDCRHGLPCEVWRHHNDQEMHLAFTDDGLMHEWRGTKARGKCTVSAAPMDES